MVKVINRMTDAICLVFISLAMFFISEIKVIALMMMMMAKTGMTMMMATAVALMMIMEWGNEC